MRVRMKVAAVEMKSDDVAMIKLYPVNEQPEPEIFPEGEAPQASFVLQVRVSRLVNFRVGKEFDLLFALPIHEVEEPTIEPLGIEIPISDETAAELIANTHRHHVEVQEAIDEARIESLHGIACNLRTGEGKECNCGTAEAPKAAPNYDLSPDERVI